MAINFDHQRDRISTSSGVLTLNTTGAFTIPVGNTAQRPSGLSTGQIRFNSQQQTFEGYDGSAWSSLGGVIDNNKDTYVIATPTPNLTVPGVQLDDHLYFVTGNTLRATIDNSGNTTLTTNLTVNGNVQIDGTLTVEGIATLKAGASGSINLGDSNTDNVVFQADVNSNIIPDLDATYDLGSITQNWQTIHVQTLDSNTDVITVDIVGALTLPVGTTLERPTATTGMIRFNTDDSRFEAYDGVAWTGVGGVIDVDQNTYIIAETSPGANNNDLDFYTDGVQRMQIGTSGNIIIGNTLTEFTINGSNGNTVISGDLGVNGQTVLASANIQDLTSAAIFGPSTGNLEIDAGESGIINIGEGVSTDIVNIYNAVLDTVGQGPGLGIAQITTSTDLAITAGNRIKIEGGVPFRIASTTTAEQLAIAGQNGDLIYNTTTDRVQIYQNGAWANVTSNDTDDVSEGSTNLYYTDARADARISAASINDLSDVDTATITPRQGQVLTYDDNTSQWRPGSVSAGGGNTLFTLLNL